MKTVKMIVNLLLALIAIAGVVYVIVTYGNQIVAWFKKLVDSLPFCRKEADFVKFADDEAAVAAEDLDFQA